MDISGISSTGSNNNQVAREKVGEAVAAADVNKAGSDDVAAAEEVVKTVAQPTEDVPQEKLPAHLGRNLNVTA